LVDIIKVIIIIYKSASCNFLRVVCHKGGAHAGGNSGTVGLPSARILPLSYEFGWSVTGFSTALSVRLLLFGLTAPFAAARIELYGIRKIVLIAIFLLITGLILSLGMTELWQLQILWDLLFGMGSGVTALVLGAIVSGRWFATHRGLSWLLDCKCGDQTVRLFTAGGVAL
jgi:hypothetical protein